MLTCRRMRGLIAGAVYEDLGEEENKQLNDHLASCEACRKQFQTLRQMAAAVPVSQPSLDVDLVPIMRRQIRHERVWPQPRAGWQLGFLTAACMAVVGLFAWQVAGYVGVSGSTTGMTVAQADEHSLRGDLQRACELARKHDYVTAYNTLQKAIAQKSDDSLIGLAWLQLADLAYTDLKWYPEAYEAYETVVELDPKLYTENAEVIARRNLLAEAREDDYAPLHTLDAAHRNVEPFQQLEQVVAKFPGGLIAAVVANDMAQIAAKDLPEDECRQVLAMEHARDKCKDTLAIARLNLELGHLYLKEMNNPDKARDVYAAAAQCPNPAVAQLAANSLASLNK